MLTHDKRVSRDGAIDRIKAAAMRLVAERGVAQMTIRDLAQAAGVSEGALYRHYETKEDLVRDLYQEQYRQLGRTLRDLQGGKKGMRARLGAVVRYACALFDDDPVTYRFLLLAQHDAMRSFPADADSPVAVLREMLMQGHKAGEVRLKNIDLAVALLLGLLVQPAASIVNASLAGPLARYADDIVAACERALLK
jgi:AcrR family transcriptional regulator